jgi:hypothetical protein
MRKAAYSVSSDRRSLAPLLLTEVARLLRPLLSQQEMALYWTHTPEEGVCTVIVYFDVSYAKVMVFDEAGLCLMAGPGRQYILSWRDIDRSHAIGIEAVQSIKHGTNALPASLPWHFESPPEDKVCSAVVVFALLNAVHAASRRNLWG